MVSKDIARGINTGLESMPSARAREGTSKADSGAGFSRSTVFTPPTLLANAVGLKFKNARDPEKIEISSRIVSDFIIFSTGNFEIVNFVVVDMMALLIIVSIGCSVLYMLIDILKMMMITTLLSHHSFIML